MLLFYHTKACVSSKFYPFRSQFIYILMMVSQAAAFEYVMHWMDPLFFPDHDL